MNRFFAKMFILLCLNISTYASVWNNPHHSKKIETDTLFSSFSTPLKRLDPVQSYSAIEWAVISQIYEPPLQYNYLKRPYELEPLTLTKMPEIRYLDKNDHGVDEDSKDLMYSEYRLELREDIQYQNHPALVKNEDGTLLYGQLSEDALKKIDSIDDFKEMGTRRLLAADYEYAIKRMAVRQNHSPILDNMQAYIVGLETFSENITQIVKEKNEAQQWTDLRDYSIEGVKVINDSVLI
ncbi:MAG: peptide ABC transporter substrate-binding protein, partial [Sulfurovum sp.]|nr:peptide ABC transporter substrate-binding protein [Sulfurovum sp.]NNJ44842.1 peptide ABC transporter substrate-binding protein [Sulfurovum sp.]